VQSKVNVLDEDRHRTPCARHCILSRDWRDSFRVVQVSTTNSSVQTVLLARDDKHKMGFTLAPRSMSMSYTAPVCTVLLGYIRLIFLQLALAEAEDSFAAVDRFGHR
jgi:hypothetical protein